MPERPPSSPAKEDVIDVLLRDWTRERPDLDASAMAVVGRLLHLGGLLQAQALERLREYGICHTKLDVLATLRRSGPLSVKPDHAQEIGAPQLRCDDSVPPSPGEAWLDLP